MAERFSFKRIHVGYWIGLVVLILAAAVIVGPFRPSEHHFFVLPPKVYKLPYYAWCSFLRMALAYAISLVFAVATGMYAARHKRAERIIVPLLDILQSIPIVSFFPAALGLAVALFGGGRFGFEIAAVVLIFTSMAWNMAFAVYASVIAIPRDTWECAEGFGIRGMQRFVTITFPLCVPRLLYNSILSWTAGWFALTACEILAFNDRNVALPGIGTFIGRAANSHHPILYSILGIATLLSVVVLMEIFMWRPLVFWAERFRYEMSASTLSRERTGVAAWYQHGQIPRLLAGYVFSPMNRGMNFIVGAVRGRTRNLVLPRIEPPPVVQRVYNAGVRIFGGLVLLFLLVVGGFYFYHIFDGHIPPLAAGIPIFLGESFLRIVIAYLLSLAWTIPVVCLVYRRPRAMRALSSISQTLASVPSIALTFVAVGFFVFVLHIHGRLGVETSCMFLLMDGVQWYVLFNLLGGASQLPGDMIEAADSMGITGWRRFKALLVPALLPSLFTGTITAFGGGWNTLIFAESLQYGSHYFHLPGLGWMLDVASSGSNPPISGGVPLGQKASAALLLLGVISLIVFIVLLNRMLWKPLQRWAADRFRMDY